MSNAEQELSKCLKFAQENFKMAECICYNFDGYTLAMKMGVFSVQGIVLGMVRWATV